jgi:CubicO group peptidase (beta-lactamase class C family)
MAEWFQTEIADPLGADFHMSLPASEDARVAELIPPDVNATTELVINDTVISIDSIAGRTLTSALLDATEPKTREWRAAEIPAAGGIGNARSIARIHSALACGGEVDGVRIMSEAGARRGLEEQIDNHDQVLMTDLRHGLGFALELDGWTTSPNENSMFWGGWGGSLAIVDFDARASISYVMNRMDAQLTGDPRNQRISAAVYAALG